MLNLEQMEPTHLTYFVLFARFSNSGSQDLDNKDDVDSGDELDGKKIDTEEVKNFTLEIRNNLMK